MFRITHRPCVRSVSGVWRFFFFFFFFFISCISSDALAIFNFSYHTSAIKKHIAALRRRGILSTPTKKIKSKITQSSEKLCVIFISHIICAKSDCISPAMSAQLWRFLCQLSCCLSQRCKQSAQQTRGRRSEKTDRLWETFFKWIFLRVVTHFCQGDLSRNLNPCFQNSL